MLILYAVLALLLGGAFCSLAKGSNESALAVASWSAVGASVLGFAFALFPLLSGSTLTGSLPVPLPLGNCTFSVDPLSSVFLLPVFLLCGIGGYLMPARIRALEGHEGTPSVHYGRHGFFYCLLAASMVLVLSASDAVFFLIAWEMMSLAPFFLISPQDRDSKERYAVWIYLLAAHLGALPLLFLFAGMSVEAGTTDFFAFMVHGLKGAGAEGQAMLGELVNRAGLEGVFSAVSVSGGGWSRAGLFFVLALIGFGVKAGLAPLHMWMPEAHASAPGHVAVLLSGTMLNLGIYGIMRLMSLLGPIDFWWAYLLMGVGAFSGLLGILIGLAQSDIKRTLAYSSAENMGIICLALGAGLLAGLHNIPVAAALLLAGAFLHMWNHSLFKSLLFLGANAVKESTHATTIQRLGGLQQRIPVTGGCFALGCAAIAGIPPLNGFMSELLIYMGFAFGSDALRGSWTSLAFWLAFFILATIAGMALFAFTRMYGLAFLGAPRSHESRLAGEPELSFRRIMMGMACLCLVMSLAGPLIFRALSPFIAWFTAKLLLPVNLTLSDMHTGSLVLAWYSLVGMLLLACAAGIWRLRKKIVDSNGEESGPTWDCGYRYPSARMQYTGGSFAHTIATMLRPIIRPKLDVPKVEGLFPQEPRAVMTTPDWPTSLWDRLFFRPIAFISDKAKDLQQGLVNIYILYILIALMTALVWALGWA